MSTITVDFAVDLAARPAPGKPTKEQALCCLAKRDSVGRLPIGFCGPDCVRRPTAAG